MPLCSALAVTGRDPHLCVLASFLVLPCLPLLQEVVRAVWWQGQGQREGQGWWWWWWEWRGGRGGVVVMVAVRGVVHGAGWCGFDLLVPDGSVAWFQWCYYYMSWSGEAVAL